MTQPSNKNSQPPTEPCKPVPVEYIVGDVTTESVIEVLFHNPRGLPATRDELSGWLRSFNQYRKGRGADSVFWLEAFEAQPYKVNRKSGSSVIYIPRTTISIAGGIQPKILTAALTQEHLEDGLPVFFWCTPKISRNNASNAKWTRHLWTCCFWFTRSC